MGKCVSICLRITTISPTSGWKPVPLILEEEVGIRIHAKLTEQILILILESSLMVMLLLVLDILYDPLPFRHRVGDSSNPSDSGSGSDSGGGTGDEGGEDYYE